MGWKTNQGHRGDFAATLPSLPSPASPALLHGQLTCRIYSSHPGCDWNQKDSLVYLQNPCYTQNPGCAATIFLHILMKGRASQPWPIPHGADRTMTPSCAG